MQLSVSHQDLPDFAPLANNTEELFELEVGGRSYRKVFCDYYADLGYEIVEDAELSVLANVFLSPAALLAMQGEEVAQQDEESLVLNYSWDLIALNEKIIADFSDSEIIGEVSDMARIEGHIKLGKGSRLLPGVFIEGNVSIGEDCKVGPNCYIRGNTHIGDKCHIGQSVEIKNTVIMSGTNVGHLSYVGDSVLAKKVNFGAGTTTSNLRHDGANHKSTVNGELVDTGRRKFGTIVGAGVHTGINTSIYPGRKFAAKSSTRPGDIVQRDV